MLNILVLGKSSYVGVSFKKYCSVFHPETKIQLYSSRNEEWKNISFSEYDVVFNVSGLCHADSKHGTPEMYRKINTELPIEMAQKAKNDGVKLFINMSSAIIFGNMSYIGEEKIIDETTIPVPVNVYGESKLEAEKGLSALVDDNFKISIIRAPLIYGENARDNFPRLVKYAKSIPIFPDIKNTQSMIYIDNLAELIYLIVKNNRSGIYMPQDEEYICTSKLVYDIAKASGKKMHLCKIFNPAIMLLSKKIYLFDKVFGNVAYSKKTSDYFDGKYRVVSYDEAIRRIAESPKRN